MGILFFKKIWGSKFRIIISSITISFVMFMSIFFASIGINIYRLASECFEASPEYNYLYVDVPRDKINQMVQQASEECAAIQETVLEHFVVDDIDYNGMSAWLYAGKTASVIPGGVIMAGSGEFIENSVLVGNSVLTRLNCKPDDFVGKKVTVNSEPDYTIIGVYDDSRSLKTVQCLVVTAEPVDASMLLLHAQEVSEVKDIQTKYEKSGYDVLSFCNEIASTEKRIAIIEWGLVLLAMVIIVISGAVLWVSIRDFSEDSAAFLALIKAQGYQIKHFLFMIMMDSMMIMAGAMVLECGWTMGIFPLIKTILRNMNISEISGLDISLLVSSKWEVVVVVFMLQIICSAVVSVFVSRKIYKKSVCDILHEVNE